MFTYHRFTYLILLILPLVVFAETSFEPNNTFEDARPVYINDEFQEHKFDYLGDDDWLFFYAQKGTLYNIEIDFDSVGVGVNPALTLYDEKENVEVNFDVNLSGMGELLPWTAPANGFYYIKVSNKEPEFSTDGDYKISVFVPNVPITGDAIGVILDECEKGLENVVLSAKKVPPTTRVDQNLTAASGNFRIPLNPGKYKITTQFKNHQTTTSDVITIIEAEETDNIKLILIPDKPEDDCSIALPKPQPDPDKAVGVYDDETGELTIKDIRIGNDKISAKLQAQDDFSFKLTSVVLLNKGIFDGPALFDFDTSIADIPTVHAFKVLWHVQLKPTNSVGIYEIQTAEPLE